MIIRADEVIEREMAGDRSVAKAPRKSSGACRPQASGSFALGAGVPFFHKLEYGLALVGELPAVRVPFDQSHRENTQPGKVSSQFAGSIRPISAA